MEFWKGNVLYTSCKPAFKRVKIVTGCYNKFCVTYRVVQEVLNECLEFWVFNLTSDFIQAVFKVVKDY